MNEKYFCNFKLLESRDLIIYFAAILFLLLTSDKLDAVTIFPQQKLC